MSISERYRQIAGLVAAEADRLGNSLPEELAKALRALDQGSEELHSLSDQVGEIPQVQLEKRLSPALLKAHGCLDRARVQLEHADYKNEAAAIWELEQMIYRLLNDL